MVISQLEINKKRIEAGLLELGLDAKRAAEAFLEGLTDDHGTLTPAWAGTLSSELLNRSDIDRIAYALCAYHNIWPPADPDFTRHEHASAISALGRREAIRNVMIPLQRQKVEAEGQMKEISTRLSFINEQLAFLQKMEEEADIKVHTPGA